MNFYLDKTVYAALATGQGNALQKVQLIVLRMLQEQGLAEPLANGFHVAAEDVAGMDDEQAEILRLPRRLSMSFVSRISGRTGHSGFVSIWQFNPRQVKCPSRGRGHCST